MANILPRVFRIEHAFTQLDPYTNSEGIKFLNKLSNPNQINYLKDKLLTKNIDINNIDINKCLFSFKNITQIRRWFNNTQLELLHSKGYVLTAYSVPKNNLCNFSNQSLLLNKDIKEKLWIQSLQHLVY